jgi:hypothetical protein
MTNEDWKIVELMWLNPKIITTQFCLKVDDYTVNMYCHQQGNKLYMLSYVDNMLILDAIAEDDHHEKIDIARKFSRPSKRNVYSLKAQKHFIKYYGKRRAKKEGYLDKNLWYLPFWTNFNSWKKHLIANSKTIELVETSSVNALRDFLKNKAKNHEHSSK